MDSQGHPSHELVGELGNELLRKLVRSVDVVTTRDQDRQFEGAEVGLDQKLGSRFGCSIGIGRLKNVIFHHGICFEIFSFTVDFIGTHVNKTTDRWAHLGRFEKHVGSVNVGMRESKGVTKRVINVCLSSKMHHRVNLLLLEDIRNQVRRADVTLDKLEVWQIGELVEVCQARAVVKLIIDDHIVLRVLLAEQDRDVGRDEPGSTGEKDVLGLVI
mmetsp:Transcript_15658/g.35920  ORF Transcript_15658/g.35920 Transcript_15658/m.35920 type:complete len:215 (+) Transcript_15658:350-994(+)